MQFSMKAIGVPLVLLVLFCLSFSVYSHHQNLLLSVYDFLVTSNSKLGRFAFFVVFNFIIVIISLGSSSKTPEADFEGFFSQTSLLFESISNTTIIIMDDKFQCSNNVDDNEHQVYDGSDEDINSDDIGSEDDDDGDDDNDTDNEHQGYDGSEEDDDEDINSDDIGSEEDDDDDENNTDNEHQGSDGSDEDISSDDIGSEEDDDDDENDTDKKIEKRAEEFIAKMKQTWREELLTERLLPCI